MKKLLLLVIWLFVLQTAKSQTDPKTIHDDRFKWTITIPQNFVSVDEAEWARLQNKGVSAVEKTYDTKVENQSKNIFVFRTDKFNYFESNYQPFDVNKDGDYIKSCHGVDEVLYQTFKAQMPDVKIDTSFVTEAVDGLVFQVFKLRINFPNNDNVQLHMLMFTRLFDKREFSVNIMYIDPKKGNLMLNAWRNSKFEK